MLVPVAVLALSSLLFLPSVQESMNSKIERQVAAEHLNRVETACSHGPECVDVNVAMEQLRAFPHGPPEQVEAEKIHRN
jgi:hypothetical protein